VLTNFPFSANPIFLTTCCCPTSTRPSVGKWDAAGKVWSLTKAHGVKKRPGYSAVEIDGDVHEFVSGNHSHLQAEIGQMIGLLRHETPRRGCDL
jgi:hypothetical protein